MTPRPPFQMRPSRQAVLTCDGRFIVAGRASFVWETFLMRRAAGVPGDYAIRADGPRRGRPWHRLDWTVEQAEDALSEWGIFGPGRVAQMRQMRESRERRGLPVT